MYQPVATLPDAIPVQWLWFEVPSLVTFFIHLILMNLPVDGSLLTGWDLHRDNRHPLQYRVVESIEWDRP